MLFQHSQFGSCKTLSLRGNYESFLKTDINNSLHKNGSLYHIKADLIVNLLNKEKNMSQENIKTFFSGMQKDGKLMQEYFDTIKKLPQEDEENAYKVVAEFCTKKGQNFTEADLKAFVASFNGKSVDMASAGGDGELNDEDLEMVAGGAGKTKLTLTWIMIGTSDGHSKAAMCFIAGATN